MASMSPELELIIFMTPIFTDKAELALEVFKTCGSMLSIWVHTPTDDPWCCPGCNDYTSP